MTSLPAAVLWDLDGTLIDTEPYWMAGERELVDRFGGTWTEEDAHSIVGFDLIDAAIVIRERGGVDLPAQEIVSRMMDSVVARLRRNVPWRPGARELLARLRDAGVPCGLVTMSWHPITDAVLHHLPPGTFRTVVTGDMVTNGKPHPEPYQRAASELRVDPLSCVAIEDSPTGVASAEAAGCVVVAVPNTVNVAPAPHRVVLDSLLGVTPEQLGEFVETTPPPQLAPEVSGPSPRPSIDRSKSRRSAAAAGRVDQRWMVAGAAALALVLAGVAIWWFALRGDEKASYEPGPFNVHAWAFPDAMSRINAELPARASNFTQLSPFWYETTGVTQIGFIDNVDQEQARRFITQAKELGVPLVPSILDHNGRGGMAAILADPVLRKAHIDTIVAFAASNDFDGIDIDYENFAFTDGDETWSATQPNWVAFIEELSERLHADDRLLTVSIPPLFTDEFAEPGDRSYWVYDYGAIAPHVDAIRIMLYDKSSARTAPGPIAPIDWAERAIDSATAEIGSPEKLVFGIPIYGTNWVTATEGQCPDSAESHISQSRRRIDEILVSRDTTEPVYDEATGETTFTYDLVVNGDTTCTQTRLVRYVDNEGMRARMQLSIDKGMLGVALFAFGYEDEGIWSDIATINAELTAANSTA